MMKIYSFEPEGGRALTEFGSQNATITRVIKMQNAAHVVCIRLEADGIVGYHPTEANQLFLVVAGQGWVRGSTSNRLAIHAGEAAFWLAGESHEAGTADGMMAIVIEGEDIDPTDFLQERI